MQPITRPVSHDQLLWSKSNPKYAATRATSSSVQRQRILVLACLLSLTSTADGSQSPDSNPAARNGQSVNDPVNEPQHTVIQAQNVSSLLDRVIPWAPSVSFFCICLAAGVIATCYASLYSQDVKRYYLRAAVVSAFIHVSIVALSDTSFLVQLSLGLLDLYFGLRYAFKDHKLERFGVKYGLWVVTMSIAIDAFLVRYISSGSKDTPVSLFATWLVPATIFSLVACEMFVDRFVDGLQWLVPGLQRVISALAEPDQQTEGQQPNNEGPPMARA